MAFLLLAIAMLALFVFSDGTSITVARNYPAYLHRIHAPLNTNTLLIQSDRQLTQILSKCDLSWPASTNELLHFWRFSSLLDQATDERNPALPISGNSLNCSQVKSLLLNDSLFVKAYSNSLSWLTKGSIGLNVLGMRGLVSSAGEAHKDQFLFVLSEAQVPLDSPVRVSDSFFTVRDILEQSLANFSSTESAEFSTMAFATYTFPRTYFTNRFGQEYSFNDLMKALVVSTPGEGTCHGVHRCYAVAVLLNLQQQSPFLSASSVKIGYNYLADAATLLNTMQHSDGAWRLDWASGTICQPPTMARKEWGDAIRVTGHHLEWIAICPRKMLDDPYIIGALNFIVRALRETPKNEVRAQYAEWSHAARALIVWHNFP